MKIEKASINGQIYEIGVCALANNKIGFVGQYNDEYFIKTLSETLEVSFIPISFNNLNILSATAAMNDKIFITSKPFDKKEEIETYGLEVIELDVPYLVGNLIILNNNGIILSKLLKKYKDIFDNCVVVNSLGLNEFALSSQVFVNNKFAIVSPLLSDEEIKEILKVLKIKNYLKTTVNNRSFFTKNGIVGNDKGIVVGEKTNNLEYDKLYNFVGGFKDE